MVIMFKVVFIGDSSVGKTSILKKYTKNEISDRPTIGVEIYTINRENKKLIAWDLSGQSKFKDILVPYIKNAHVYVLVFDLSRKRTLENLKFWSQIISEYIRENSKIIVVGNKKDLNPEVSEEDVRNIFNELSLKIDKYVETSALKGENVSYLFELIGEIT